MYLLVFCVGLATGLSWFYGWQHFPLFFMGGVVLPMAVALVWWGLALLSDKARDHARLAGWHRTAGDHREALTLRYRQLVSRNPYGGLELKSWAKELERFRVSTGIDGDAALMARFDEELTLQVQIWAGEEDDTAAGGRFASTDPYEYERWCASQLRKCGWQAEATQASGDQGVDVVASKGALKVALQCKLHNNAVGNKAIQEVHAAAAFVDATHAAVVSPANYTRGARQLATKLDVLLLHHTQLAMLDKLLVAPEKEEARQAG